MSDQSKTVVYRNPTGAVTRPSWRPELVLDAAIGTDELAVLEAYDLQAHEYKAIQAEPLFKAEVARVKKELERDGVSFRLKARVQAEAMLERSWEMVHDRSTPPAVVADLIKSTTRWAGFDGKDTGNVSGGAQFSININLSGNNEKAVIEVDNDE